MASARPIHEVFDEMLYSVLGVTRYAGIWRIHRDSFQHGYHVEQIETGGVLTLRYHDKDDWHGVIEFNNITQSGLSELIWGDPVYGNLVDLGSIQEEIDNRLGVDDFPVNFRDLFSESESSSSTDSTSATQSLTVKAAVSIEGVGSLETEAMASATEAFEESEGKDSTGEEESSGGTVVPGPVFDDMGRLLRPGKPGAHCRDSQEGRFHPSRRGYGWVHIWDLARQDHRTTWPLGARRMEALGIAGSVPRFREGRGPGQLGLGRVVEESPAREERPGPPDAPAQCRGSV